MINDTATDLRVEAINDFIDSSKNVFEVLGEKLSCTLMLGELIRYLRISGELDGNGGYNLTSSALGIEINIKCIRDSVEYKKLLEINV